LEAVRRKKWCLTLKFHDTPFAVVLPLNRYLQLVEEAERKPYEDAPISVSGGSGTTQPPDPNPPDEEAQNEDNEFEDEEGEEEEEIDEPPLPYDPVLRRRW
jgi:hypothetical protein